MATCQLDAVQRNILFLCVHFLFMYNPGGGSIFENT